MRSAVKVLPALLLGLVGLSTITNAETAARIAQPVDSRRMTTMRGNVHPMARAEFDQGALDPSQMLNRVSIFFTRTAAQQQALDKLLEEQQDPSSGNYHQWLTPKQFGAKFGLAQPDLERVKEWLASQGFTINEVSPDRAYITFSGSAGQIASAFQTELHQYSVSGDVHFANATEPAIPAALNGVVAGIRSLNDFKPRARATSHRLRPDFTSSLSGNTYLAPDDFANIYNLQALFASGIDGTGQKIAVMGQTDIVTSDIATFRSVSNLPTNTPQVILVPGSSDPGVVSADITEAALDVEWAGAVARNATVIYVNSKNGVFDSMNYAISHNVAPVISISYGDCEANFTATDLSTLSAQAQQANAQGQTIVGPSGDDGAADCDYSSNTQVTITSATHGLSVDVPAALPFVTSIGGTAFSEGSGSYWSTTNDASQGSAFFYIPEVAWNDTSASAGLSGTGGGVSKVFTKPSWQTGTGVPHDGFRDVPDISFNASPSHDGFITCVQGDCQICVTTDANCATATSPGYRRTSDQTLDITGGTSAGVPTFAGIVALMNQKVGGAQGNVNPRLYALAASTPYVFHDVTVGDNRVPCTAGTKDCANGGTIGYSAGTGYDQVTGLGSVDVYNLVTNWNANNPAPSADFAVTFFSSALSVTRGTTATIPIVLRKQNGFAGSVSLSCASAMSGVTCSVNPGTVNPDGTATVTITASSSADLHPPATPRPFWNWWDSAFGVAAFFGMAGKRSKRQMIVLATVGLALLIGLAACGGGGSSSSTTSTNTGGSTSTGTSGTVTLTASSGSLAHTAQLTVRLK